MYWLPDTLSQLHQVIMITLDVCKKITLFPTFPVFWSLFCLQYNTRKQKSGKNGKSLGTLLFFATLLLLCIVLKANLRKKSRESLETWVCKRYHVLGVSFGTKLFGLAGRGGFLCRAVLLTDARELQCCKDVGLAEFCTARELQKEAHVTSIKE